jgi:hypothetical protein
MIISKEYNLRLNRPNTFTFRRQKTINNLAMPKLPRRFKINNDSLDPRKSQDFITPSPLPRKIPTDEEMEQERMKLLTQKKELTTESLANFFKNTIFLAPKIGIDGKPILNNITGEPILENQNLLNLLKTKEGAMSALNIIVDKLHNNPNDGNFRSGLAVVLDILYEEMRKGNISLNKISDILKKLDKTILNEVNEEYGLRTPRGPESEMKTDEPRTRMRRDIGNEMSIGEFVEKKSPGDFFNNNLRGRVSENLYKSLLKKLYQGNPNIPVNLNVLKDINFWKWVENSGVNKSIQIMSQRAIEPSLYFAGVKSDLEIKREQEKIKREQEKIKREQELDRQLESMDILNIPIETDTEDDQEFGEPGELELGEIEDEDDEKKEEFDMQYFVNRVNDKVFGPREYNDMMKKSNVKFTDFIENLKNQNNVSNHLHDLTTKTIRTYIATNKTHFIETDTNTNEIVITKINKN